MLFVSSTEEVWRVQLSRCFDYKNNQDEDTAFSTSVNNDFYKCFKVKFKLGFQWMKLLDISG